MKGFDSPGKLQKRDFCAHVRYSQCVLLMKYNMQEVYGYLFCEWYPVFVMVMDVTFLVAWDVDNSHVKG
jgi:hypothetical protein